MENKFILPYLPSLSFYSRNILGDKKCCRLNPKSMKKIRSLILNKSLSYDFEKNLSCVKECLLASNFKTSYFTTLKILKNGNHGNPSFHFPQNKSIDVTDANKILCCFVWT